MDFYFVYGACLVVHFFQYILSLSNGLFMGEKRFDDLFVVVYFEMLVTILLDTIRNFFSSTEDYDIFDEFYKFCPKTLCLLYLNQLQNDIGTPMSKTLFIYSFPIVYILLTFVYIYNQEEKNKDICNIINTSAFVYTIMMVQFTILCFKFNIFWLLFYIIRDAIFSFLFFTVIHFMVFYGSTMLLVVLCGNFMNMVSKMFS